MGYTTEFYGHFTLNRPIEEVSILKCMKRWNDGSKDETYGLPIDGYCQWEFNTEFDQILWDGGEKFYHYGEWLQIIIDKLLSPNGYVLLGKVSYQGEATDDFGEIKVIQDVVVIKKGLYSKSNLTCPHCGKRLEEE
jgi:hypothetical protein